MAEKLKVAAKWVVLLSVLQGLMITTAQLRAWIGYGIWKDASLRRLLAMAEAPAPHFAWGPAQRACEWFLNTIPASVFVLVLGLTVARSLWLVARHLEKTNERPGPA